MSDNDPIGKAFGITPLETKLKPSGKIVVPKIDNDYEYGRQNLVDLIEKGTQILNDFTEVAASAQEPRHYEVLTNLLTSLIDAQEKLLNLKKKNQEIDAASNKPNEENNVTNNLFIGSTAELQDALEVMRANKKQKNDT